MTDNLSDLETALNDFSYETRSNALRELLALAGQGAIELPTPTEQANMHCHTFYSFNGYGYSPTALAWLARKEGIKLIGSVDFDVLDAVDEFLTTCAAAGVRASSGIETRVYIPEFADREINSPGEPGVAYHMGIGFTGSIVPAAVEPILSDMRQRAAGRNRDMLNRVNSYLAPVALDYEQDVLPLTPSGNATERHMLAAYLQAANTSTADPAAFWAEKLGMPAEQVSTLMESGPKFSNTVRARLMKRGGVGYVQPGPDTFPTVDEFHRFIEACGALPCAAWLDGLSTGEQAIEELLTLLIDKGVVAFNIVPDRNWNIADPELKKAKIQKLYEIVELTQKLELPLNIGTEMNAFGQRMVDDFNAPELAPVREAFLDGAYFIYGHTVAQRAWGKGYQSQWAKEQLPGRGRRNTFFTALGKQVSPGPETAANLQKIKALNTPDEILQAVLAVG
jgi:hypothetical protein